MTTNIQTFEAHSLFIRHILKIETLHLKKKDKKKRSRTRNRLIFNHNLNQKMMIIEQPLPLLDVILDHLMCSLFASRS